MTKPKKTPKAKPQPIQQTAYRMADLPGLGRVRVPAHLSDDQVLAALAEGTDGADAPQSKV